MAPDESGDAPNRGFLTSQPIAETDPKLKTTAAEGGFAPQTSEGTSYLQRELQSSPILGKWRSKILKKAIQFMGLISNTVALSSTIDTCKDYGVDSHAEPQRFPPELLYMMTMSEWRV